MQELLPKVLLQARESTVKTASFEVRFDATLKRLQEKIDGLGSLLQGPLEQKLFEIKGILS